eukprot:TRINITY_DN114081_c0_g1_i1.p1 TRINITY_DN114081_c0_g1~~TRINITY_DN114081_c0_g1_i1.p1  ORF type:complete len:146 (+),score=49.35 TRINITY_DN114081_c0_g1_i1:95-532(+)
MVEIYIPKKNVCGKVLPPTCKEEADDLPDEMDMLEAMKLAESESIAKLRNSNEQLLEALAVEEDKDFREAVDDNEVTLKRKQARLDKISKKLEQLRLAHAAVKATAATEGSGASANGGYHQERPRPAGTTTTAPAAADLPEGLDL